TMESPLNPVRISINNGIRTILRNHRGMSETHMKRAAEWFLTLRELPIDAVYQFIDGSSFTPATPAPEPAPEPVGPALYDTGLDAGEGLWLRAGWAGRS